MFEQIKFKHTHRHTESSPREIFSPESAGSRKTRSARVEMRTQGMRRLRP